jgi:hypothetical protein
MMVRTLVMAALSAGLPSSVLSESSTCERLKATLTYTQEEAPRDLSSVVRNRILETMRQIQIS